MGITQEQFALGINLPLAMVQQWEQGREPDQAATNYLRVMASAPATASKAQVLPTV